MSLRGFLPGLALVASLSCEPDGPGPLVFQNRALRIFASGGLAGADSCSAGSAGLDTWCAFFGQKTSNTRGTDLWVVNASHFGGGSYPRCDGSDRDCRLIARGDHIVHWGFVGDTLLVDAVEEAAPAADRTANPVLAWRPDWDQAQTQTDVAVLGCWVDPQSKGVACLEPDGDGKPGVFRAGRLSTSNQRLTLIPGGRATPQFLPKSDGVVIAGASNLQRLDLTSGQVQSLTLPAETNFSVTDDEKWLLLPGKSRDDGTQETTLWALPFPNGGAKKALISHVTKHRWVRVPHGRGREVAAQVNDSSGQQRMWLAGPADDGSAITLDLGPWVDGTSSVTFDDAGFATLTGSDGVQLVALAANGPICKLAASGEPITQAVAVPSRNLALWTRGQTGHPTQGVRAPLDACDQSTVFANDAQKLQVAGAHLLFSDSTQHLRALQLLAADAEPVTIRDPDEVVTRWDYAPSADVLFLLMTSIFQATPQLFILAHPF